MAEDTEHIKKPYGTTTPPGAEPSSKDDGTNLLDLLIVIAKQIRMIASVTAAAALGSVIVVLLLPKIYTGTVVLMPPQEDQSGASAMLGQLIGGSSSNVGGIANALGLKNPNDLYVGILQSRTIADRLIKRFKLNELYDQDTLVDTRKELANKTGITAEKNGLITIEFEDEDPKRAADVANAYVEELENLTARLAISDASRRRVYYQQQVRQAKEAVSKADHALMMVQKETGLIKPDDQASAIFQTIAGMRAQISAKEIELGAMTTYATPKNPDFIRAREELLGLKEQMALLEKNNKLGGGNIFVPTGKVPEVALNVLERWRDVKYSEALYELVAKQLELAKIDEGKNATIIQTVDKAVVPDKKSKPKGALIVILTTLFAGFAAVTFAFLKEAWVQILQDPRSAPSAMALLGHLRRNTKRA